MILEYMAGNSRHDSTSVVEPPDYDVGALGGMARCTVRELMEEYDADTVSINEEIREDGA